MPEITFLNPLAQFNGEQRFLEELRNCFQSDSYSQLRLAVAFAKSGPFKRLLPLFKKWKENGKTIEAIFGVDHYGTTKEALEYALENFTQNYVLHVETRTASNITFHPKFYLFSGDKHAVCFCGSHNFTVGGTETNLEWGVKIEFNLPEEEIKFNDALQTWKALLPSNCQMCLPLDENLLEKLVNYEIVLNEKQSRRHPASDNSQNTSQLLSSKEGLKTIFPIVQAKPPSPIPKEAFSSKKKATTIIGTDLTLITNQPIPQLAEQKAQTAIENSASVESLVIEIIPHKNGEVFLSKTAVNQNPQFFDFPFTGQSSPKKDTNESYPQRTPDPRVRFRVFDANGNVITNLEHSLNMVYYEKKKEIRVTFPSSVRNTTEEFSIMLMQKDTEEYDYLISIFNPNSSYYQSYIAICNQPLPSGGAKRARKFGWL